MGLLNRWAKYGTNKWPIVIAAHPFIAIRGCGKSSSRHSGICPDDDTPSCLTGSKLCFIGNYNGCSRCFFSSPIFVLPKSSVLRGTDRHSFRRHANAAVESNDLGVHVGVGDAIDDRKR